MVGHKDGSPIAQSYFGAKETRHERAARRILAPDVNYDDIAESGLLSLYFLLRNRVTRHGLLIYLTLVVSAGNTAAIIFLLLRGGAL